MATEAQNLSREMAHAYLTGTGPRTNRLSSPAYQKSMTLIMQNKANLPDTQMNVGPVKTKYYENNRLRTPRENKPNQTQSQTRRTGIRAFLVERHCAFSYSLRGVSFQIGTVVLRRYAWILSKSRSGCFDDHHALRLCLFFRGRDGVLQFVPQADRESGKIKA